MAAQESLMKLRPVSSEAAMQDAEARFSELAAQAGRAAHQRVLQRLGKVMKAQDGQLAEAHADSHRRAARDGAQPPQHPLKGSALPRLRVLPGRDARDRRVHHPQRRGLVRITCRVCVGHHGADAGSAAPASTIKPAPSALLKWLSMISSPHDSGAGDGHAAVHQRCRAGDEG
jgi:hypothetical protein